MSELWKFFKRVKEIWVDGCFFDNWAPPTLSIFSLFDGKELWPFLASHNLFLISSLWGRFLHRDEGSDGQNVGLYNLHWWWHFRTLRVTFCKKGQSFEINHFFNKRSAILSKLFATILPTPSASSRILKQVAEEKTFRVCLVYHNHLSYWM